MIYHSAYIGHQAAPNANTHFNHNVFFLSLSLFFLYNFFFSLWILVMTMMLKKRWMMVAHNLVGDICAIIVFYNHYNFLWNWSNW